MSEFLTVAALESESVGLKNTEQELNKEKLPSIFVEAIINWIRLLFLTDEKLYCSKILPITPILIEIVKQLKKGSEKAIEVKDYLRKESQMSRITDTILRIIESDSIEFEALITSLKAQLEDAEKVEQTEEVEERVEMTKLYLHLAGQLHTFGRLKTNKIPFP